MVIAIAIGQLPQSCNATVPILQTTRFLLQSSALFHWFRSLSLSRLFPGSHGSDGSFVVVRCGLCRCGGRRCHPETAVPKDLPFLQIPHRRRPGVVQALFHFRQPVQVGRDIVAGVAVGVVGVVVRVGAALRPIKDPAQALSRVGLQERSPEGPGLPGEFRQCPGVPDRAAVAVAAVARSGKGGNGPGDLRGTLLDQVDQPAPRQEESFVAPSEIGIPRIRIVAFPSSASVVAGKLQPHEPQLGPCFYGPQRDLDPAVFGQISTRGGGGGGFKLVVVSCLLLLLLLLS
mmetsp:Transcript_25181/g.52278  ORF Transcript_25181/g.52278 Transcript_25181/m.52278 type:complete len:288 (-) Transcript_25181:183-1046(-)